MGFGLTSDFQISTGAVNGDDTAAADKEDLKEYEKYLNSLQKSASLIEKHSKDIIEKQKGRDQKIAMIHSNMFRFSLYCAIFILIVKLGQLFCVRNKLKYKKLI